jgi:hypothetical protein
VALSVSPFLHCVGKGEPRIFGVCDKLRFWNLLSQTAACAPPAEVTHGDVVGIVPGAERRIKKFFVSGSHGSGKHAQRCESLGACQERVGTLVHEVAHGSQGGVDAGVELAGGGGAREGATD